MEVLIKSSENISQIEWLDYVYAFNEVFKKDFKADYFKQKYFQTIDNKSYHALLKAGEMVVGGCSVIPYDYKIDHSIVKVGLAVDVFIRENFRTDPLALYRMYNKLKKKLREESVSLVVAVPNETVYSYWKNVVKWKDVGFLNYYALPVKAGNIIKKHKWLNFFSKSFCKLLVNTPPLIKINNTSTRISIDRTNAIIESQRYTSHHIVIRDRSDHFSYRVVVEEDVRTCYLIDFYKVEGFARNASTLRKALYHILEKEQIDLVVFVGKLSFVQHMLFKVPVRFEPKRLYFSADIIIPEKIDTSTILKFSNWDFGLFNYDVR